VYNYALFTVAEFLCMSIELTYFFIHRFIDILTNIRKYEQRSNAADTFTCVNHVYDSHRYDE
jgi:hypothetical protein